MPLAQNMSGSSAYNSCYPQDLLVVDLQQYTVLQTTASRTTSTTEQYNSVLSQKLEIQNHQQNLSEPHLRATLMKCL